MTKKAIFVIILAAFLIGVYADGSAKDIPMKDIEKQLIKNTDINKMEKCSNRDLMHFFNLDYEQYDSHIYYKGKEALSVDEILIIKAYHKDDLNAVKDAVEKRIDSQTATFEGYGPQQVALLKNSIVITKGKYLFYGTGKNADTIKEVFTDAV